MLYIMSEFLTEYEFRYLLRNAIVPLTRMWAHPQVLEQVKEHVIVFKPDVSHTHRSNIQHLNPPIQILPSIVEWTTFGLCSMLRRIWSTFHDSLVESIPVPHYWVELVASLERTLNYAHTGNAKVLTRGLMDPLWLSQSLVYDGFPCLSTIIGRDVLGGLQIRELDWPTTLAKLVPQMASKRSMTFNFSEDELKVSTIAL